MCGTKTTPSPASTGEPAPRAWHAHLTPIDALDPEDLHTYTLNDAGPPLKFTSKGVRWKSGYYVGEWMHGHGSAGEMVRLRHEPHHYHRIEVYEADTLSYRGAAFRSDEMSPRQARQLRNARRREADRYAAKARRARKDAKPRYAATTTASALEPLNRLTASQAAAQPRQSETPEGNLHAETRPHLLYRPQPDSTRWTKPLPGPKPQDTK